MHLNNNNIIMKTLAILLFLITLLHCSALDGSSKPFQRRSLYSKQNEHSQNPPEERELNIFDDLSEMGRKIFNKNSSYYMAYGGASLLMSTLVNYIQNTGSFMKQRKQIHDIRISYEKLYIDIMDNFQKRAEEMSQKLEWAGENLNNTNIQENFQKLLYLKST